MSSNINKITSEKNSVMVHQVDISHVRLSELSTLADQAKPFYDWIERNAMNVKKNAKSFEENIINMEHSEIKQLIENCYYANEKDLPLLFDGIGRTYKHKKACFYFFSWIIRDAPQQRLRPLITRMRKKEETLTTVKGEIDALSLLYTEYRKDLKTFEWQSVREVVMNRLEGSRRSLSGHAAEANIRAAISSALQNYYRIHFDYGVYEQVSVGEKQIKIGNNTIDVSVKLHGKDNKYRHLYIPVKSRETEGGGHAHLFSRDVISAVNDIKKIDEDAVIAIVIIARNWSEKEIETTLEDVDGVFHFDMNPNELSVLDEQSQKRINLFIEKVLRNET